MHEPEQLTAARVARARQTARSGRVADALSREGAPLLVVGVAMAIYVGVFGWLTWQQQRHYGTFGFDMGIHDQGIWLLSRFKTPYVTVVGRNYLGHHLNLVAFLYVPFYWLGAGPKFLYFTETLALAFGAVPVYLLARDQLHQRWLGTAFATAYLLHPTLEWINWWHFHPDALMVTPLLFAWWFATKQQWRGFAICCFLAMFAKEDATTAVIMIGLILTIRLWKTNRRVGLVTMAGGLAWFLVATKLLMPHFNHGEPAFYEDFFPGLGNGLGTIVRNAITHPSRLYDPLLGRSTSTGIRHGPVLDAFRTDVYRYYLRLLIPMSVLALRKPLLLLIGAPMLVINVLSSLSYTHDAKFHYSSIIIVAIVLATIEGCKAFGDRRSAYRWLTVAVVVVFALVANVWWSPSPLDSGTYHSGIWVRPFSTPEPLRTPALDHMVALVPSNAGVSATYSLVPHVTHRVTAYEFPNPWWVTNWLDCGTSPQPDRVDTLLIDTVVLDSLTNPIFGLSPKELFERLTDPADGEFSVIAMEAGVVVAQRVRPPALTFDSPRPKCK